jgi:hypothetical protein
VIEWEVGQDDLQRNDNDVGTWPELNASPKGLAILTKPGLECAQVSSFPPNSDFQSSPLLNGGLLYQQKCRKTSSK